MKNLMTAFLLGAMLLCGTSRCHAWSKANFGMGLNWSWQGGGNSALWGLVKGSPMPEAMMPGGGGGYGGQGFGGAVDGAPDPSQYGSSTNVPQHMPSMPPAANMPEKLATSPLKPASYSYLQQPVQAEPQASSEDQSYFYPSYWYGR